MKLKTFIVLLVILCSLSIAAFYLYSHNSGKKTSGSMGEQLFKDLPLEKVSKITISSDETTIRLKKEKALWVIENRYNYLADFSVITQVVTQLKDAKVGRSFKPSDESLARLGLILPDNEQAQKGDLGTRIEILDDKNSVLLDLILGKTRDITIGAGEGTYVMLTHGDLIYLVDKKFDDVGKSYLSWMKKNIIDIEKEEIGSITCFTLDGNPVYSLVRPEKGQWPVLEGRESQTQLNKSKLDDLLTPLSPLEILDIAGHADDSAIPETAFTHYFDYMLYDGTVYRITPGERATTEGGNQYLLKARVKQKPVQQSFKDPINDLMPNWVYVIPQWRYKRFITQQEDLLETTK